MGVRGVVWDEIDFDDELYNVKYFDRSFTNVILGVVIVMLIYAGKR